MARRFRIGIYCRVKRRRTDNFLRAQRFTNINYHLIAAASDVMRHDVLHNGIHWVPAESTLRHLARDD